MPAILEYDFMRRAFAVGLLLAVIVPCIGVIVVFKRLSMIGDALSHTSLAGVAAGLILGINPILGAVAASIAAALAIEAIRKRIPRFSEMAIAIIMSAGIGLAGVLSGFVKSAANFNSFLFGSIVAIDDFELLLVACISCAVILAFILLYKELFYIALDERAARLAGVPVGAVNFIFTILTAVTVSVAARTVGALIVSSLMVLPVACAMQFGKSYRQTVFYAVGFGLLFTLLGLTLSYYMGLRPGGTIVLIGVACLALIFLVKKTPGKARAKREKNEQDEGGKAL
jgi:zinc transport system permease protein